MDQNDKKLIKNVELANRIAKDNNFKNHHDWINYAEKEGIISYSEKMDFEECISIRNMKCHPGPSSSNVNVSNKTVDNSFRFVSTIKSSIRRKQHEPSHNKNKDDQVFIEREYLTCPSNGLDDCLSRIEKTYKYRVNSFGPIGRKLKIHVLDSKKAKLIREAYKYASKYGEEFSEGWEYFSEYCEGKLND